MKKILLLFLICSIALKSIAQVVINPKGTKILIDSSKWKISGSNIYFKNTGNIGIGTSAPAYKLDITAAANPIRLMGVQNGNITTDSMVTILNGVVKKVAVSTLNKNDSTTANNGLTLTGKNVQLGGNLTQATIITNNSNPLTIATGGTAFNITGLTAGASTDSILTINTTTGKINRTSLTTNTTVSNTNTAPNSLTTTVNGVTGAIVPIVNSVSNNLTGNNLTTTVNGVTGAAVNLAAIIPATTHTVALSGNTLTSTVNGIAATSNTVSTVTNTSTANTLTTTVNGVAGSAVNIINSNTLTLSGGALTSTVNGVATSPVINILATANNGLTATAGNVQLGGSLIQATTIVTNATNTLALQGLQNGLSTDSLLVSASGTAGVIKKIAAPQSFPQLLVDARRTTTYAPGAAYVTLIYNTAGINTGGAYNTSTGVFTAPATGLYEIIVNNGYNWSAVNVQIVNQIIVNGAVDMEKSISSYPTTTTTNSTVSGNTIVSITAGQTVSITVGGEIGTVTPQVGAGQHVLKIIRLQ